MEAVVQFLNTLDERSFSWHGKKNTPSDRLAPWLQEHGLTDPEAAVALRAALRAALTDGNTDALAGFPLRLSTGSDGLRITATSGLAALDSIVETVATSVAGGDWHRMKLCSSPDCRWAFYDTSRNGGSRWCFMEVCGNRNKTRAYRNRQKTG